MRHLTGPGRPRRLAVMGLTVVAFGLIGAGVYASLPTRAQDAPAERAVAASKPPVIQSKPPAIASAAGSVLGAQKTIKKEMPNPVRISIPAIGVDAPVIPLGLNSDRTLEVPKDYADTGWFQLGPEPGEQGAAVIVGHRESLSRPGVFDRLPELRVGQVITIHIQGGSTVRYVADSMRRVPKNDFPTNLVYAQTKQPTLRLITCAGKMNPTTGYHAYNYIVFASLAR